MAKAFSRVHENPSRVCERLCLAFHMATQVIGNSKGLVATQVTGSKGLVATYVTGNREGLVARYLHSHKPWENSKRAWAYNIAYLP